MLSEGRIGSLWASACCPCRAIYLKYLRGLETLYGGGDWQPFWSARSVLVVEVNGYTIEPGAFLEAADLTGADLEGADLTGAIANEETTWPDGFDPKAAGVIFASERPPGYPTWDVPLGAH